MYPPQTAVVRVSGGLEKKEMIRLATERIKSRKSSLRGERQQPAPRMSADLLPPIVTGYPPWMMALISTPVQPTDSVSVPGVPVPGIPAAGVASPMVSAPGAPIPGVSSPRVSAPGVPAPGLPSPRVSAPGAAGPGLPSPRASAPVAAGPEVPSRMISAPMVSAKAAPAPGLPGTYMAEQAVGKKVEEDTEQPPGEEGVAQEVDGPVKTTEESVEKQEGDQEYDDKLETAYVYEASIRVDEIEKTPNLEVHKEESNWAFDSTVQSTHDEWGEHAKTGSGGLQLEGSQPAKEDLQLGMSEPDSATSWQEGGTVPARESKVVLLRLPSQKEEKPVLVSKPPPDTEKVVEEEDKYWLRGMRQELQHVRPPSERKIVGRQSPNDADEKKDSTNEAAETK